ncbi:hypothetical protein E5D57_012527 [Metarhizium anisopliae]|nr:hypothetical protein E5D57_012527 [Metarhizium anisopliae]
MALSRRVVWLLSQSYQSRYGACKPEAGRHVNTGTRDDKASCSMDDKTRQRPGCLISPENGTGSPKGARLMCPGPINPPSNQPCPQPRSKWTNSQRSPRQRQWINAARSGGLPTPDQWPSGRLPTWTPESKRRDPRTSAPLAP